MIAATHGIQEACFEGDPIGSILGKSQDGEGGIPLNGLILSGAHNLLELKVHGRIQLLIKGLQSVRIRLKGLRVTTY